MRDLTAVSFYYITCEGNVDEKLLICVAQDKLLSVQAGLPGLEDCLAAVLHLLVKTSEVGHVDLLVEGVGQAGLLPHLPSLAMITAPTVGVAMSVTRHVEITDNN